MKNKPTERKLGHEIIFDWNCIILFIERNNSMNLISKRFTLMELVTIILSGMATIFVGGIVFTLFVEFYVLPLFM